MLLLQHTKFILVSVLVWEGYSNAHFNHITWLCSETVRIFIFHSCVSVCLELYLPISRSVLLFMVVTSSQMLLGPSSTELCFYLHITETTTCNSPFKVLVEGQWRNLWQGKASLAGQSKSPLNQQSKYSCLASLKHKHGIPTALCALPELETHLKGVVF